MDSDWHWHYQLSAINRSFHRFNVLSTLLGIDRQTQFSAAPQYRLNLFVSTSTFRAIFNTRSFLPLPSWPLSPLTEVIPQDPHKAPETKIPEHLKVDSVLVPVQLPRPKILILLCATLHSFFPSLHLLTPMPQSAPS